MADLLEYGLQTGQKGAGSGTGGDPGDTVGVLYEDPAELANGALSVRVIAGSPNDLWAGCAIYISNDGATYSRLTETRYRSHLGELLTDLAAGSDDYQPAGTVDVDLAAAPRELQSTDVAGLYRNTNLCVIGSEVISWQTALLLGTNQYRLTGLLRARYDTERAAHVTTDPIRQISVRQLAVPMAEETNGLLWYYKLVSFNGQGREQDISAVTAQEIILTGRGLHTEYQQGRAKQFVAGEALTEGALVYLNPADGLVYLAVSGSARKLGLVQSPGTPVTTGQKVYVQMDGLMTCPTEATPTGADWNWTPGASLYASSTPGALSETANGGAPVAICLESPDTILLYGATSEIVTNTFQLARTFAPIELVANDPGPYTLSFTPLSGALPRVFFRGDLVMKETKDYTISGNQITLEPDRVATADELADGPIYIWGFGYGT